MTEPRHEEVRLPDREEYGPSRGRGTGENPPSWDEVRERLQVARYFWIATVRGSGKPHTVPVSAVWREERLYFSTHPRTVTGGNIAARGYVRVHLEDARRPVIVDGTARLITDEVPTAVLDEYEERFDLRLDPADPETPLFVLVPEVVFAWISDDIRNTSIRWRLG